MIEKNYGNCDGANCKKPENVLIVHGWTTRASKLCAPCDLARKKAKEKAKASTARYEQVKYEPIPRRTPISRKPTERLADLREEDWEVNYKIWDERKHECVECRRPLPIQPPPKFYFSHVLGKGPHPELRFDPDNIVLHCHKCHRMWETAGKERRDTVTYKLKLSYMISKGYVPND